VEKSWFKNFIYADSLLDVAWSFAVGASRLSYLSRPIWCLNQRLANLSITDTEDCSTNSDLSSFVMFMKFTVPTKFSQYMNNFDMLACEST
jgi:hypothetical protein